VRARIGQGGVAGLGIYFATAQLEKEVFDLLSANAGKCILDFGKGRTDQKGNF
jgi:hypothetical protein